MKNMKRLMALLMAMIMIFGLSGCGGKTPATTEPSTTKATEAETAAPTEPATTPAPT